MASSMYGVGVCEGEGEGTARNGAEVMVKPPGLRIPALGGG